MQMLLNTVCFDDFRKVNYCCLFFSHLFVKLDNRLIEKNCSLQNQCRKFETDVNQLRLANAGLEKASEARYSRIIVHNKNR